MINSEEKLSMKDESGDTHDAENEPIDIYRRMTNNDLLASLGPVEERSSVISYVCGPPTMTDWAVATLKNAEGMKLENVLFEKWW